MKLNNKVAAITGGNSGIGLATAREFVANGARVAIFGRDPRTLDAAAASLGRDSLAVRGDVRNLDDIDRFFSQVGERFGQIDILVANAGIAKFAPVESLSETLFDELSDVHFKGTFFTVQKALPYLRDGASVILVGSSYSDKQGLAGISIYHAAKAAVRSLVRSLAVELLPRRIRVNMVGLGSIETPILTREGGPPGVSPEELAAGLAKKDSNATPRHARGGGEGHDFPRVG